MPRKAFVAHIKEAIENPPKGLSSVSKGEDDGDLNMTFTPSSGEPFKISLIVTPGMSTPPFLNHEFCGWGCMLWSPTSC